ncbi:MAG: dephospho-CoA kinase [Pirellulales bacterium]|nr:dephospho-CoA kinase [Pirellulales bacterium]
MEEREDRHPGGKKRPPSSRTGSGRRDGAKCRLRVVGILGGVASGKSLVAQALVELGAGLLDADRAGHDVLRLAETEEAARRRWGEGILGPDGRIDRAKLAKIVFAATPEARTEREYLEQLTHPAIGQAIEQRIQSLVAEGKTVAVLDAALLLEAGWDRLCDTLVFVDAPRQKRLSRARSRGWSEEGFAAREAAQKTLDSKRRRADVIIDNSDSPEWTKAQIEHVWHTLVG